MQRRGDVQGGGTAWTHLALCETRHLHLKPPWTRRDTSLVLQSGLMCRMSVMASIWSLVFLRSERSAAWKRSAQGHTGVTDSASVQRTGSLVLLLLSLLTVPLNKDFPHRLALTQRGREQGMLGDRRRRVGEDVVLLHLQLIGKRRLNKFGLPEITRIKA